MQIDMLTKKVKDGDFDLIFQELYGDRLPFQQVRFCEAFEEFKKCFPGREDVRLFSASGRTEIGGNHTDHQRGCVLAAAVNLDTVAVVSFHEEGIIRIVSKGYAPFQVDLNDLSIQSSDCGSASLVRGIAHAFVEKGVQIGGFDLYCVSDVLSGSGISSSAAFEILIGTVMNCGYCNGAFDPVEIAKIGQYAENVYFGKKSGLMDQMVSSVGGLVSIDFESLDSPKIQPFTFDFSGNGYEIIITDTKGNHNDLTDDYVAIRAEMESVASYFGKSELREVNPSEFYSELPLMRKTVSDRALLRASHFFEENQRAMEEADALRNHDLDRFLELVNESGESSAFLLQNLFSTSSPTKQEIPLAIYRSKSILKGNGAVRVHGGGFAGTIQAFVPKDQVLEYISELECIFGVGSCHKMRVRPYGGIEILPKS